MNEKEMTNTEIKLNHSETTLVTPIYSHDVRGGIHIIRGTAVMIDRDLALLYSVDTKRINEQARRNIERFPERFRFQLSDDETAELVAFCDRFKALKHSTVNPFAYTEQGVAMLATVIKSEVPARIITRKVSPVLATDLAKHNQQYPPITVEESSRFHDRFLIIDATVYHIGASLKDLGKKLFAFSRLDIPTEMLVP